jgi:hypothetical protein
VFGASSTISTPVSSQSASMLQLASKGADSRASVRVLVVGVALLGGTEGGAVQLAVTSSGQTVAMGDIGKQQSNRHLNLAPMPTFLLCLDRFCP